MDRIPKKLKLFFDGNQKVKYRLAALLAFLESAPEAEQQKIYREYADPMVTFVVEYFNYILEKLGTDKEYYSKFERAFQRDRREMEEIFKIPLLLEQVIRQLRNELSTMAQTDQLINLLRVLLHPGNQVGLRREGMRLLMFWLREEGESCSFPELITLFASVVPLNIFLPYPSSPINGVASSAIPASPSSSSIDSLNRLPTPTPVPSTTTMEIIVDQVPFPLAHPEEPAILPIASQTLTMEREQALAMLITTLDYITYDVDADRRSTLFLYGLLRAHYLIKLYPHLDASQTSSTLQSSPFIEGCPAALQAIIMRYFAMWITQDAELFVGPADSTIPPGGLPIATFILQEIIMNGPPGDRDLVHQVLAQSLRLPPTYKSTIRLALSMLRSWIFTARERRPEFLLKASEEQKEGEFDRYLRQYIGMVTALFYSSTSSTTTELIMDLADLYKEAMYFYRGIAMKVFFTPQLETWDALLGALMNLADSHLSTLLGSGTGAVSINTAASSSTLGASRLLDGSKLSEEFAQLLTETLFGVLIRAETKERKWWERLAHIMSSGCTRWKPVVEEWSKVMNEVTDLLIRFVLAPSTGSGEKGSSWGEESIEFVRKKLLKSGTFEGAHLKDITLTASSSALSRAIIQYFNPLAETRRPLSTSAPLVSDSFRKWNEASWTRENIVFLWRNILRALGDPNSIPVPANHEVVIECLARTTDRLRLLRDQGCQPYYWRPLPPLFECVPYLLDACDLPARPFAASRYLAYGALGRLFFRRHDMAPPTDLLIRFYLALVNGLSDKDDPGAAVIIVSGATELFGWGLPGSTILVPSLLKCIAALLNAPIPPDSDRVSLLVPMMRMAGNVAILPPALLPTLTFPRIEAPLPIMSAIPITCAGEMDLNTLRLQARDFLLLLDGSQEGVRGDAAVHATWLSVTTTALIGECLSSTDGVETILLDSYLNALLEHLLPLRESGVILPAIHDQFYALAQVIPLLKQEREVINEEGRGERVGKNHRDHNNGKKTLLDGERPALIVQRLIIALRHLLSSAEGLEPTKDLGKESTMNITQLLYNLLEWLMVLPANWLSTLHNLREQVFTILEDASCLNRVNSSSGASKVAMTAEFVLAHLLHHMGNYSPVEGGATLNSALDEDCDDEKDGDEEGDENNSNNSSGYDNDDNIKGAYEEGKQGHRTGAIGRTVYLAVGDTAVLAIQQRQKGKVRMTIRNMAGKFTWEATSFYDCKAHFGEEVNEDTNRGRSKSKLTSRRGSMKLLSAAGMQVVSEETPRYATCLSKGNGEYSYKRILKELPVYPPADKVVGDQAPIDLEQTDMLNELLNYLEEEHGDCINSSTTSTENDDRQRFLMEVGQACSNQTIAERSISTLYRDVNEQATAHPSARPPCLPDGLASIIPFAGCRRFMADLGFFDPRAPISSSSTLTPTLLRVLARTAALKRDLEGLDQLPARETIKMGILYVAPGQEDEQSILRNTLAVASPAYKEFIRSLGWKVNLKRHAGYKGGLEAAMTEDGRATYYANSTVECIFHEAVTLVMEGEGGTGGEDPQLITKKRHIGNDHVHIIWNEHYREYRANSTIRTEFANVQIVVTPIRIENLDTIKTSSSAALTGTLSTLSATSLSSMPLMYRINVWREVGVPVFGPLYDGAIIPPALLGILVRTMAINAHRAVINLLTSTMIESTFHHPMVSRANDLRLVMERHAQKAWTMDQFMSYVMFANKPLAGELVPTMMATSKVVVQGGSESITNDGVELLKGRIEEMAI